MNEVKGTDRMTDGYIRAQRQTDRPSDTSLKRKNRVMNKKKDRQTLTRTEIEKIHVILRNRDGRKESQTNMKAKIDKLPRHKNRKVKSDSGTETKRSKNKGGEGSIYNRKTRLTFRIQGIHRAENRVHHNISLQM